MMRRGPSLPLLDELKLHLTPVVRRLPAYTRLLWALYRDPSLSRRQRLWLAVGLGYSISPVDLIPGLIPGLGQLDDLYVVLRALARVMGQLPEEQRRGHLEAAGVEPWALEEDLGRVRAAIRLLVAAGLRGSGRAAVWAVRTTAAYGSAMFRAGGRTLRVVRARLAMPHGRPV
ncbi:YkvA family protein [Limnochorda pilosa]|uniref:DUF1232 domain-containing protein n=1 Tax=Limnochorda pilosa TaxID=1555112 RepID=A0A0K2SHU1_LIMPI|nr:DUF1232 domain-containing protein [Limnochorda pilosa]BAS26419.1 hypothetical protein LIP_0562 [Limnochorda pilosa]